jgi:RNA polymerase sigma-70 factor, ECF subfamily
LGGPSVAVAELVVVWRIFWNFSPSQTEYVQDASIQEGMSDSPATDRLADEVLLQRTAAGDREAFAALYRRRRPDVFRFAVHMTADASVAEDLVQDVFMTVMEDAARFEAGRAAVVAWLCGIARNQLRQRLARDRRLEPLAHDEDAGSWAAAGPLVLSDMLRVERVEAVRRAVLSLPLRYREAVVLCDLQELSYADAAAALASAVGTVRSRLHRGRALLASKLAAGPHAAGEGNGTAGEGGFSRPGLQPGGVVS